MRRIISLFVVTKLLAVHLFGQSRAVTGVVKDENGVPIPFATVNIRGAKGCTQTLSDGTFTINVPAGKTQLEISNIGSATQFLNIPDGNVVNASLVKASTVIEDVVITGYTTKRKPASPAP